MSRRVAAFDVGSNSVKLCVAELRGDGARILADEVRVCGLARGLSSGERLDPEAMDRCALALAELVALARDLGASEWVALGTEALRRAANAADFIKRLREDAGLQLEVISGEEEARLALRAALVGLDLSGSAAAVFDTGGGSTEFVLDAASPEPERLSLPLGVLRLTEAFKTENRVSPELFFSMREAVAGDLAALPSGSIDPLVGIGGTVTSLGALMEATEPYDPLRVHAMEISKGDLEDLAAGLCSLTLHDRERLPGLMPARAPLIPAGAAIVLAVMDHFNAASLRVSVWGLRHALISERWGAFPAF